MTGTICPPNWSATVHFYTDPCLRVEVSLIFPLLITLHTHTSHHTPITHTTVFVEQALVVKKAKYMQH